MEKIIKFVLLLLGLAAVFLLVQSITETKLQKLQQASLIESPSTVPLKTIEKQLDCLAINIYREAGHESFAGKVGVAQVTMNRVKDGRFGVDVCGVVYQKNVVMEKVICQFSWHCDSVHRNRPINKAAYDESYSVAKKVLLENFRLDMLKDALYYHANYVNPQWSLDRIGSIGVHIFYKQKGNKS